MSAGRFFMTEMTTRELDMLTAAMTREVLLGKKAESRACHERLLTMAPSHPTVMKNSGFFAAHSETEDGGT